MQIQRTDASPANGPAVSDGASNSSTHNTCKKWGTLGAGRVQTRSLEPVRSISRSSITPLNGAGRTGGVRRRYSARFLIQNPDVVDDLAKKAESTFSGKREKPSLGRERYEYYSGFIGCRYIANEGHEAYDHWTEAVRGTFETFCGVDVRFPSSHRFTMLCWNTPISSLGKIRSLSNLLSRNLFLGNIPDTAWRMICKTDAGHNELQ